MLLNNHKIIVTGGAKGIGAAAIEAFISEGAEVVSLDIAASVNKEKGVTYLQCDIANASAVKKAFAEAEQILGGLDGLVNCAGIEEHLKPEDIQLEQWQRMVDVNITGTFLTNQVAFEYLKNKGGCILNFGSDAGLLPYPTAAHYSASKGAVMAWTRSVSRAWGSYNVRVNSIVPAVWTPMYDAHRATLTAEELAAHDAAMAAVVSIGGRLGDPAKDLAPVLVFMLSEGARFITGQLISVNGGANTLCG